MMTAGHIAKAFGCVHVTINYGAAKLPAECVEQRKNAVPKLEWAKYGCSFSAMLADKYEYLAEG